MDVDTPYTSDDTRNMPLLVVQQEDSDTDDDIEKNSFHLDDQNINLVSNKRQNENQFNENQFKTNQSNKTTSSIKSYYYRDKTSGIIFLLHIFVIFILSITSGSSFSKHSSWGAPTMHQAAVLITSTLLLLVLSGMIGIMWLRLLIRYIYIYTRKITYSSSFFFSHFLFFNLFKLHLRVIYCSSFFFKLFQTCHLKIDIPVS